jgi:hypothetical protein
VDELMTTDATAPDARTVREIAREYILDCGRNADDIAAYVWVRVGADLTKHEHGAWCSAIRKAIRTAQITVSWPDEQQPDERTADAADLDREDLVEIFCDFIGEWDRSHEVITVGLPDHLPQLRIPHLRRAVLALQRLGRDRDALAARVAELEGE